MYNLEYATNGDNKVYTLDFTKSDLEDNIMTNYFFNADKFSEILKKGLDVTEQSDIDKINEVITKLFEGDIDGAKKRMLIITEKSETIDIMLSQNGNNLKTVTINSYKNSFGDFLMTLGDDINPIQSNPIYS